jgi:hypothetical protein
VVDGVVEDGAAVADVVGAAAVVVAFVETDGVVASVAEVDVEVEPDPELHATTPTTAHSEMTTLHTR